MRGRPLSISSAMTPYFVNVSWISSNVASSGIEVTKIAVLIRGFFGFGAFPCILLVGMPLSLFS